MVRGNPVSRMASCLVMVRPVVATAAPNVCLPVNGRTCHYLEFSSLQQWRHGFYLWHVASSTLVPLVGPPRPTGGTPHCQTLHPPLKIPLIDIP